MKKQRIFNLGALVLSVLLVISLMAGCQEEASVDKPAGATTTTSGDDASGTTTAGSEDEGDATAGSEGEGDATSGLEGEGGITSGTQGGGSTASGSGNKNTTATGGTNKGNTTTTKSSVQGGIPGLIVNTTTKTTTTTKKTTTRPTSAASKDIWSQIPSDLSGQKLKVLAWWNVGDGDNKRAEEFKKKTGISVTFETAALDKYQTRLSGMIMANNAPGLAAIINEWFPQPITRGLFQTIDVGAFDMSDPIYDKALMDQFKFKDKYYAVGVKGSTMTAFELVYWNKTMYKNAGLKTTPETLWESGNWNWETCLDLAKKMTNSSTGQYGMALNYQNYWMLSAGTDFVKIDSKEGIVNNAKDSAIYDAWKWGWDMMFTHKVVDPSAAGVQNFYNGKVSMFACGSWLMQANMGYLDANMKDEWGVVPFPSPKGQKFVAACEGAVWGIPSRVGEKKAHASSWFLRYWLDQNYQIKGYETYAYDWCQEFMDWIWEQPKQSMNSSGILTYGAEYSTEAMQLSLMDNSSSYADIRSNIDSWHGVFDANIKKIMSEMS